jgi:hypothetical protein
VVLQAGVDAEHSLLFVCERIGTDPSIVVAQKSYCAAR